MMSLVDMTRFLAVHKSQACRANESERSLDKDEARVSF